jgi:hypothetical protein
MTPGISVRRTIAARLTAVVLLASAAWPAWGKDLQDRLGFGLSFQSFHDTTSLSLRYCPTNYVIANFLFGFNTDSSEKSTTIGVKLYRHLILEENMNFSAGIGGFILSQRHPSSGNQDTGVEFDALLGGEFFLQGLPHLGFQFEAGLALQSVQTVVFRTIGGGFAGAGIHYYF